MPTNNAVAPSAPLHPRVPLYFAVTFFFWFANFTYVPTMSPYLRSIGVGYSMIGLIGGAYGFAQLLLRVPIGILSDRLGKRKIFIIGGLFFGALSNLLFTLTENAVWILLFRFLAGVSASAWVVYTVLFSSYFSGDKTASRISYLSTVHTSAVMAAKLCGSVVAGQLGYRAAFYLGGAAGLLGLVLSLFVTENIPVMEERPSIRSLLGVIKDRNLLTMAILAAFSQMLMFASTNTFTPEVASLLGADAAQLGILATLSSLPTIVCSLICGWLFARHVNLWKLIAFAFFMELVGTLMVPFATSVTMIYIASIVSGFGFGICLTSLLSHCTLTIDSAKRSVAMGFYQAIYSVGMFAGPVVVGALASLWGVKIGVGLSSLIAAAGLFMALALLRRGQEIQQ